MMTTEQVVGLGHFLLQGVEGEQKTTAKILAAVPENNLGFQLGDKGRTTRDLMWHIVASDIWFLEGIVAGAFDFSGETPAAPDSVAAIVDAYNQGFAAGLAKVKALSPEAMAKPVNFYNMFNFPAIMYLQFANNHMIHHRGQLSMQLRAMNAHHPQIYGGSADEPLGM